MSGRREALSVSSTIAVMVSVRQRLAVRPPMALSPAAKIPHQRFMSECRKMGTQRLKRQRVYSHTEGGVIC